MTETHEQNEPAALRRALLAWYARHKRDLPWRVAAVLEHYRAFLQAFPTVQALALAAEERVLAAWSGLGYYRRARMMHRAAKLVVSELGGVIPPEVEGLRKLPGVGNYTAAAIASIAYDKPVAVVDGNVERVLSRLDGAPRAGAVAWQRAQELLDRRHAGDWNQAMMELGATVCTPRSPQCLVCPVRQWCRAPGAGTRDETRKPRPARKRVQMTRALIERGKRVFLVQRPADEAQMAGMWELPEFAGQSEKQAAEQKPETQPCAVRHSITSTDYEVRVVRLGLKALGTRDKKAGRWVAPEEMAELPLTGLTRKILRKLGLHGASARR
jgi:A/G-specific adenine glycosylase